MSGKYLEEVIELTGVTERNVKYWSHKFDLPVRKEGRRNIYPEETVNAIHLLDLFADTELFTHRFIGLLIDRALGRSVEESEVYDDYERVRRKGANLLAKMSHGELQRILPSLAAGGIEERRPTPARRRAVRPGTDLDEGIL